MQQSSIIFAALLVAFIVFITQRGELPTYLTLLRGGGTQPNQQSGVSLSGTGILGSTVAAFGNNLLGNSSVQASGPLSGFFQPTQAPAPVTYAPDIGDAGINGF